MSYRAIIQKSHILQFTVTKAKWRIIAKNESGLPEMLHDGF